MTFLLLPFSDSLRRGRQRRERGLDGARDGWPHARASHRPDRRRALLASEEPGKIHLNETEYSLINELNRITYKYFLFVDSITYSTIRRTLPSVQTALFSARQHPLRGASDRHRRRPPRSY